MKGHTSKDCWTREENKDKRLKLKETNRKKAVIAVERKMRRLLGMFGLLKTWKQR
jgi:hypothetical protein